MIRTLSLITVLVLAFGPMKQMLAQDVVIHLERRAYRLDESILITFKSEMIPDSTAPLDTTSFIIVYGPQTSSSTSYNNKVRKTSYELGYTLKARSWGSYLLAVPDFFKDSVAYSGLPITIEVSKANMSLSERHRMELKILINKGTKPKGSERVTMHGDLGYVEQFDGSVWVLKRELSIIQTQNLRAAIAQ